jgi:Protein of unknown function (DUF1579)
MQPPKPQQEHDWLRQLTGEWTFEHDAPGPDGTTQKITGTESGRMIGDVWVMLEGRITHPDGTATTVMSLGYDPEKQRFIGTFLGSMMTDLWVYEDGQLDPSGRALHLSTEGPDFSTPGARAKYVDTIEVVSADERLLISKTQGADGNWSEFMRATYRRA